jgi:HEAT repeat protein
MQLFGIFKPNVKKMEAKEDIEGLVRALGYKKDPSIRKDAAMALGRIGSHRVTEALKKTLEDEDINVKSAVEMALKKVKNR